MARIRWTKRARDDLRQIHDYIARDSRQYAVAMVNRIKSAAEGCRRFPLASPRVEEWDRDDMRETYVGPYRIIYRASSGRITILAIVHSARRLPEVDSLN